MEKIQVKLSLGVAAPTIKEQLAQQGLYHENAERFEKERKALNQLYFSNALTEVELQRIGKRLFKRFTKGAVQLDAENE